MQLVSARPTHVRVLARGRSLLVTVLFGAVLLVNLLVVAELARAL
jgi:hypothetical protein